MDVMTSIIWNALRQANIDTTRIRKAGAGMPHKKQLEMIGLYIKWVLYESLTTCEMPAFAAECIVEVMEHRINWQEIAESFLTVPEWN